MDAGVVGALASATNRTAAELAEMGTKAATGAADATGIRKMLADDVRLDLVNRLDVKGRDKIASYFTRYAQETKWRFALGAVEGRPAMLVFDIYDRATRRRISC